MTSPFLIPDLLDARSPRRKSRGRKVVLGAGLMLAALAGCAQSQPNLSVTDRATIAACRSHADQVYDRLNRGAIYNLNSNDAPNSSTGLVGDPTAELSARFSRDRMIARCVGGAAPAGTAVAPSFSVPATLPAR
jgi:hypothetical protein